MWIEAEILATWIEFIQVDSMEICPVLVTKEKDLENVALVY